jgi:hypothetical protein
VFEPVDNALATAGRHQSDGNGAASSAAPEDLLLVIEYQSPNRHLAVDRTATVRGQVSRCC